jgi:hypothetical protein
MILRANHPHNHVIIAICRGDKRRAATASDPVHVPPAGDGRWIGRSNAESGQDGVAVVVGPERDIGVLFGPIGDGCLEDRAAGNLRYGYRRTDPAEVVPIKQIHVAVLTESNHEVRRHCVGYVHQQGT